MSQLRIEARHEALLVVMAKLDTSVTSRFLRVNYHVNQEVVDEALCHLSRAGLIEEAGSGIYELTDAGENKVMLRSASAEPALD